jgi:hypothetical protein
MIPDEKPSVDLVGPANGSYKIERIGGRRGLVEIGWQSGHTEISTEQYAEIMGLAAPGMTGQIDSHPVTISGHQGKLLVFPVKEFAIHITVWYCDQHDRDYTLGTMLLESPAKGRAFHDRIAAGFECHVGDKPAVVIGRPHVEPTADYGYVEGSDPPSFYNLDGDELAFQPVAPIAAEQIGTKPELVLKMFELVPGITDLRLDGVVAEKALAKDGSPRGVVRVRYREGGDDRLASVTAIVCKDEQSYLAIHTFADLTRQANVENVLLSATCPKGRPTQKHATVAQVFGKACDGKDPRGCYMLALLARGQNPRQLESEKAHLERGCKLDHGLSCNDLGAVLEADGNTEAAAELFKKACQLGEKLGCETANR